jgi:heme/copper-type cytochrome/quinol oxidase subunit 4
MVVKIIVIVLLLAVVGVLFSSVFFLIKDDSSKRRTLALLKLRVALSLTLIVFVVFAYLMGWIHPHGITPTPP